jgi:hypothetical protein
VLALIATVSSNNGRSIWGQVGRIPGGVPFVDRHGVVTERKKFLREDLLFVRLLSSWESWTCESVTGVLATLATWIVLSVLGVPYALSLGFVVGFFDLIPLVGATLGAIVVALATLTVSFPTATIVWVAFIIVWQRFEDYVVQPLVYGRALRVNPIVTIISVLAGAELLGIRPPRWPPPTPPLP